MCEYFASMCVYAPCAYLVPRRSEESIRCPEAGDPDGSEVPCGCWEVNPGPLQEQQPSLQPPICFSKKEKRKANYLLSLGQQKIQR